MVAFFSGVGRHAGVSHNPGGDGVDGGGVAFGQFEAFSELFVVVVDAGYGFLNDDYPGMDMCYASPEFVEEFKTDGTE